MSTNLREDLATFEKDLATLVARFIKLYERLETEVRPERAAKPSGPPAPATAPRPPEASQPLLPGYH